MAAANAIHLNINFDGTQNDRDHPATGESMTNIGQLANLQAGQKDFARNLNTIYMSGIGAQTAPSDAKDANGNPLPGSSPSNLESTPWKAGEIGIQTLEDAYLKLATRVAEIRANNADAPLKKWKKWG